MKNPTKLMKKTLQPLLVSVFFLMTGQLHAQDCFYEEEFLSEYSQETCDQSWFDESNCCNQKSDCSRFYGKILGGVNFLQETTLNRNRTSYKTGYLASGFLGFSTPCGVDIEFEYAFRRNGIKKIHFYGEGTSHTGHIQTSSYMGNLVWDLPLSCLGCSFETLKPFLGAGLGYDFRQMHASNSRVEFHQKWRQFSWQVMAGLSRPCFCNTEITFEYKYHQGGSHFHDHALGVGLLYRFGFPR